MPYKIADAKVHEDPVGVSGALIEGRHYYDAYVRGRQVRRRVRAGSNRLDFRRAERFRAARSPAMAPSAIRSTALTRATLDSAKDYVPDTPLTPEEGCQIRAFATEESKYPSPVAEGV